MGGLLAAVEGTSFQNGFLYVASNLLGMANSLTTFNPQDPFGITIDVYVSVVALLCFGIVMNVVHLFHVPKAIDGLIKRFVDGPIVVPLVALGFFIPLQVSMIATGFGVLLGLVEGWTMKDGILYVFSNLLSLGNPLTDVVPETFGGDLFDIVISSMALGSVAIFVDYVSSLNPARYIGQRAKEFLEKQGLLVDSDDSEDGGRGDDYYSDVFSNNGSDHESHSRALPTPNDNNMEEQQSGLTNLEECHASKESSLTVTAPSSSRSALSYFNDEGSRFLAANESLALEANARLKSSKNVDQIDRTFVDI
ncbi:hypothetical protein ACA910_016876 [Epithemia clementina (nom. ined.)]